MYVILKAGHCGQCILLRHMNYLDVKICSGIGTYLCNQYRKRTLQVIGCFQNFNRWSLEVQAATDWEANCYYSQHMSCGNLLEAGRSYNSDDIHLWNLKSIEKVFKIHIFLSTELNENIIVIYQLILKTYVIDNSLNWPPLENAVGLLKDGMAFQLDTLTSLS